MTKKEEELIKKLQNSVKLAKECGKNIAKEFKKTDNYIREIPITEKNEQDKCCCKNVSNEPEKCESETCCCHKKEKEPWEKMEPTISQHPKDSLFEDYGIVLVDEEGYGHEFNDYLTGFGFIKGYNNSSKGRATLELEYTFDTTDRWIPAIDDLNILEKVPAVLLYETLEEAQDINLSIKYRNYTHLMKNAKVLSVSTDYLDEGKRKVKIMLTKNYDNEK